MFVIKESTDLLGEISIASRTICFVCMSDAYFSDREFGARARDVQEITPSAWRGMWGAIVSRQNEREGHPKSDLHQIVTRFVT
jgi:hypothetical protein